MRVLISLILSTVCLTAAKPTPGAGMPPAAGRDEIPEPALSREQAANFRDKTAAEVLGKLKVERAGEVAEKSITLGGQTLRWLEKEFNLAPEGKRSLWISMHGGGNAAAAVNDSQWRNQISLYQPAEGIYVAPRAPTDTWNLWHEGHIDPLFDRLIADLIAVRGVDPDKVYLMGYSAGGDGVWQLAPRMADRFAAASMMAGHPNDASLLPLRNLPFAIFMGGADAAFGRNRIAAEKGVELDALRKADPQGYEHRVTIYDGLPHWMDRKDREAVPWMAEHVRNPWPKKVVWVQDDVTHDRFYWLQIPAGAAKPGRKLVATVDGNTISLEGDVPAGTKLHLSDALVDLDQPVVVRVLGEERFAGKVPRSARQIVENLRALPDAARCGYAVVEVSAGDRGFAVATMDRIARPVIESLAAGKLKERIPLGKGEEGRRDFTCLEAFGRTLSGIAPWLALGSDETPEGRLRAEYIALCQKGLINATNPESPDFMNFTKGSQPLVDAAFLAVGLLRAPEQLWDPLDETQRKNLIVALESTRAIKPYESNWLLFSAAVEAALWKFTGECGMAPIEKALEKHEQWYLGDGTYGDGPDFHWDHYNSFVIQPFLIEVLKVCEEKGSPLAKRFPEVLKRSARYAEVQERMISPEGTFPVIGRSSAYRFGAFQTLSLVALRHELPGSVDPAAVRCGLNAVIRKMTEAPGTFDKDGWLQAGVAGYQPAVKESYISTGSLYLCLDGMLHLGLPAEDPLWMGPARDWTQKRLWAGEDVPADHAR